MAKVTEKLEFDVSAIKEVLALYSEVCGMQAENDERSKQGLSQAYTEFDFAEMAMKIRSVE